MITASDRKLGKLPYDKFRVYLVAHSMGGLVVRAFLQNPVFGTPEARALVDKVFTYATPHNGIEIALLGNVPSWLALYGMNTSIASWRPHCLAWTMPGATTTIPSTSSPTSTRAACSISSAPILATTRRRAVYRARRSARRATALCASRMQQRAREARRGSSRHPTRSCTAATRATSGSSIARRDTRTSSGFCSATCARTGVWKSTN